MPLTSLPNRASRCCQRCFAAHAPLLSALIDALDRSLPAQAFDSRRYVQHRKPHGGTSPNGRGLTASSQCLDELLDADTRLLERAGKCAGLELAMIGHDAAGRSPSQHHMASALARDHKAELLWGANNLRARRVES